MEHGHVFGHGGNLRLGRRASPASLVVSLTNGIADTSLMDEYQPHDEWPIRASILEGEEGKKEEPISPSSLGIPDLVPPIHISIHAQESA